MDCDSANRMSCVVCGIETKRHTGWFLVLDNCWLDRLKILTWHPVLAECGGIRGVCGKQHLKILLTHWLNHANLHVVSTGVPPLPMALDTTLAGSACAALSLGRIVGELAVERDPLSPGWTGSPETMECILDALIGETEIRSRTIDPPALERLVGYSRDYAFR